MGSKRPKDDIFEKYYYVDSSEEINRKELATALKYYDKNYNNLQNKDVLTIIDFSKHSGKKRFYIVDINSGKVNSYHTSHGKGTDGDHNGYADNFSNTPNSKMSSIGFYKTAETYYGKHGYSLRLDGLSASNSKARSRAIVIHGASYVNSSYSKMGRSWGCPALSKDISSRLINEIKGGSVIYSFF